MSHFHLRIREPKGEERVGALCTTDVAAREEADVERGGVDGRHVDILRCDRPCWATRVKA
ncbi:MAG: hypothetical protein ACRENL_02775 [Candidatus Dormibacteria bacterium]